LTDREDRDQSRRNSAHRDRRRARSAEAAAAAGARAVIPGRKLLGQEKFSLDQGVKAGGVTVPLRKAGRKLLKNGSTVRAAVSVTTRGARGEPVVTRVRLHP